MTITEIINWAHETLEMARKGRPLEDSRVELKSAWIEPSKAARRLAGHANAALGEMILWLVGVKEDGTIASVGSSDFATWWPQVRTHFDGPVPHAKEVNVHEDSGSYVAIAFETEEVPYVVRNPNFGQPNAGPIEREVPWREMTGTRSARHEDLIRILVPRAKLPKMDIILATLVVNHVHIGLQDKPEVDAGQKAAWLLTLELYCEPRSSQRVVFPIHLMELRVSEPGALGEKTLSPFTRDPNGRPDQRSNLIVERPEKRLLFGSLDQNELPDRPSDRATLVATLPFADSDRPIVLKCDFKRTSTWGFELSK